MATSLQSSAHQNNFSLETVISDEILEELYAFRETYAEQFDYNLEEVFADLRELAKAHPVIRQASIKPVERKLPQK